METQKIVESLITPNGKTIADVFQKEERYFIDIYQRDYKWNKEQIETLLKDIELHFNQSDLKNLPPKEIKADVVQRFKPYFLNTFLTSKMANHIAIVDGQQRLTTFLIIFIKLRQLVAQIHNDDRYTTKTVGTKSLDKLIFEANDFDEPEYYKIYNENRQEAFNAIRTNDETYKSEEKDESSHRIVRNYKRISAYFDSFFKPSQNTNLDIDVTKLTYYIYYIQEKLNIVEIKIEQQENVSTVFEVVNDRGLGLKPYEILKGKLIGNLSVAKKEKANEVWVQLQDKYYQNDMDLDVFFKAFLRSKFANNLVEYEKFEGRYHYEIYQNNSILEYFKRFSNSDTLYNWVINDFAYFADLYLRIRTSWEHEYLVYNSILDQNQQYLLIMSAISLKDEQEKAKIDLVTKKFDQLHSVIRLLDAYNNSSEFQGIIHQLNSQIRNKELDEIAKDFDSALINYLEKKAVITPDIYHSVEELFRWELFQNVRNRHLNFSKYVLMRIDRHLSRLLDKPSYCDSALVDLFERFNKNNRKRHGIHLEHIYAYNKRNINLFTDENNVFDESKYNQVRNNLGMLLLLKDSQNISSNNDYYKKKVQDYKMSNFIWNELLVGHIHNVDTRHLPEDLRNIQIEPNEQGVFPLEMVESRQRAVFAMIKEIWCF